MKRFCFKGIREGVKKEDIDGCYGYCEYIYIFNFRCVLLKIGMREKKREENGGREGL